MFKNKTELRFEREVKVPDVQNKTELRFERKSESSRCSNTKLSWGLRGKVKVPDDKKKNLGLRRK